MTSVTVCAVGDVRVDHRKAGRPEPGTVFDLCRHVFRSADISYFNCEGIYTEREVTIAAQHTPSSTPPENFRAMAEAGFAVAGLANNHGLDHGAEALLDTIDLARGHGILVSGAGRTIEDARRPAIVEREGTKVAFLSYNCVGPNDYTARRDRPGVASVRIVTAYQAIEYQPGTPCRILTFPEPDDLAAMERDVAAAKREADVVVVNFHWGMHHVEAMISMYQPRVAYAALDAGADVILGEHDHVVKGIEVRQGKVIFYGLGDFVLDTPITEKTQTPWRKMKEQLYGLHYDPSYPTYPFPPEARNHMIAKIRVEDGAVRSVSYLPCTITPSGQPEVLKATDPRFREVADYVSRISVHQGLNVELAADGDEIAIRDPGLASRPIGPVVTRLIQPPLDPSAAAVPARG